MSEKKRVLITGSTGFIGRHACDFLVSAGYEVIAMVRSVPNSCHGRKCVLCDLGSERDTRRVMEEVKPDYILHLAGLNNVTDSWKDPGRYIHMNVMGTVNLLEAVRNNCPGAKLVVIGSMLQEPFAGPFSHPYSLSKTMQILAAKTWERLFDMDIVIVKPSNLIGPGPSKGICSVLAEQITRMEAGDKKKPISIERLDTARDFLDVRDAVRALEILFARGEKGHIYELGTGVKSTVGEIIKQFKSQSRVAFEVVELNPAATSADDQEGGYSNLKDIYDLGWEPAISLSESLEDVLDYHRMKQGGSSVE